VIVAVTGACGNLASAILPRLVARADVERVIGLDLRAPRHPISGVEYRTADVTKPDIAKHLAIDALFHLAFVVMGSESDVERTERINIGGTRNVITAAIEAGVGHITYASSIAAYGAHRSNVGVTLSEDAPLRGNRDFAYSRTKADVEQWIESIESASKAPPIARMRPSAFLASRGRGAGLLRGPLFPVLSGADYPSHLTHQDDVADAFVRAFVRRASGPFNVATRDPLPGSQWPAQLGKRALPIPRVAMSALELAFRAGIVPVDTALLRFGEAGPINVTAERARRELGWRPRFATTAEVLRELGNTSTSRASVQTKVIFGAMAEITRWRGGLPVPADRATELRSFAGAVDIILGGERPSSWHLIIGRDRIGVGRGRAPQARAAVRLDENVLFELLSGELAYPVATMTGLLRFSGDAGMSMLIGGFFTQLGRAVRGDGSTALPDFVRRWLLQR